MIFLYFEFGYETLMTISFQDSCALWENGKTQGVLNINTMFRGIQYDYLTSTC